MAVCRRTAALAAITALIAVPAIVGCGSDNRTLDCGRTAKAVARDVDDFQAIVGTSWGNPVAIARALDEIDKSRSGIHKNLSAEHPHWVDATIADDSLGTAVLDARKALEEGGKRPDLTRFTDASARLTKACSS
ncbi:hypothetical protein [Streptomyces sp. NPDC051776]|uniref:hypothetical protein n=1 Tax=Streptomyces sp. NPDC051776 TaxID=3155414 RepID=UPI00343E614D